MSAGLDTERDRQVGLPVPGGPRSKMLLASVRKPPPARAVIPDARLMRMAAALHLLVGLS